MGEIKVLQVNKLYYPVTGGIERVVQQIAEGLNGRVAMKVLVCQKKGATVTEQVNGVEVTRAGSFGMAFSMPLSAQFFSQFRRLSKDCDIVHIHMPFPLADMATLLSAYKGKVVLWWHCDVVRQKKLLLLYKPFMLWLLKRADCIMVATKGHIDGSAFLPQFRGKCVIIPFGVDPFLLKKSEELAQIPMPSHDPLSILFVGRLVYYKGCEVLLNAFSQTHGAELNLVGDGPLKELLQQQANELGISDRVHFLGNIDEDALATAFANCDFFVLPSVERTEAFGLVQSEAMAYGKPVINTNLPTGVPYVSLDGQTGFTVEPGDVDALAAAMQRLIDDRALREQFAQNAYRRARNDFSMDAMLDSIYSEYKKLVK